jgi:hypothetical protein
MGLVSLLVIVQHEWVWGHMNSLKLNLKGCVN